METYDPDKIGRRLAFGRSHSVYCYGDDQVIKVPRLERWLWPKLRDRLERDITVCRTYFGAYFLDTRIVRHPATGKIATIQPRIRGHYLCKKDIADPLIKRQVVEFLQCQDVMVRDGYRPVDLVGQGGVLQRRLSNVMVLPDKTIRLYDAVIIDTWRLGRFKRIFRLVAKLILRRQAATIRFLLS